MNHPSQIELATLAAQIQGSPHDRATAALAIWKACGEAIAREADLHNRIHSKEQEREELDRLFPPGDRVLLMDFLKGIMPQSKVEDRMKKFRDYMRDYIPVCRQMNREYNMPDGEELSEKQLDTKIQQIIARLKSEGYARDAAVISARHFQQFIERATMEARSKRGRQGAAAKKALGDHKTARKSPQAKRKPRQA